MPKNNYKNRYINCAHISEAKFRNIVRFFCLDLEANKAAILARVNRNTINRYYRLIRERISDQTERSFFAANGIYDAMRVFVKHDMEAFPAVASQLYGIVACNGRVYIIQLSPEASAHLEKELNGGQLITPDGLVNAGLADFDGFLDFDNKFLLRSASSADFLPALSRKSTLEVFWRFVKSRLFKFNGVARTTRYLHIKECEFRFNNRDRDIYKMLLKMFRNDPLK